jgi:hypothetical protein
MNACLHRELDSYTIQKRTPETQTELLSAEQSSDIGDDLEMADYMNPEFLDIVNYAVCETVNEYMNGRATEFFRRVGEYHLEEALRRGVVRLEPSDKPLDALIKIAKYLESYGYMEEIRINRIDEKEATVEMLGVSVTDSSAQLLGEKRQPSHYMTNVMFAALKKLGVQAELRDMDFNREKKHFKEYWKILSK